MVDSVQPKDPCTASMASCIEAMCQEKGQDVSWESWAGRVADLLMLSKVDAHLEGRTPLARGQIERFAAQEGSFRPGYAPDEFARARGIRTTAIWGGPGALSGASDLRHTSSTEKAEFRRMIAGLYLRANPDFCKPKDRLPDAITQAQRVAGPVVARWMSPDLPLTSFGRPIIGGMIFPTGKSWVNDATVAGGASVTGAAVVYGVATALEWAAANWFVWVWAL